MKKIKPINIKVDVTKLPNKMHFEIQKASRATIQTPKKGKGSYRRNKKVEDYE